MTREKAEAYSGACPFCGKVLVQTIGTPNAREIVTKDEYRDKKTVAGVEKLLEERAKEHFRQHELPRMIEEKGLAYAQEHGFVDQDGKAKS